LKKNRDVLLLVKRNIMYDIKKTLKKIAKYVLLVGIPFLTSEYPDIMNMTIGAFLVAVYDYLKHSVGIKLP